MGYLDTIKSGVLGKSNGVLVRRPCIYRIPDIHDQLISDDSNKYLVIKGGRGGFKTTSYVCALIEYSYLYKDCAFLFTREIAKSITDSVYSEVKDKIEAIGEVECSRCTADGKPAFFRSSDFLIGKTTITNKRTNVKFLFMGLRATGGKTAMSQINKVKGLSKIRMVMMEEGQDLSEDGLNVLFPTVNRGGTVNLYNPKPVEELPASDNARFFVAMNPNKEVDPIISKLSPFMDSGEACIAHINMTDIGGELGDTEPRTAYITINGVTTPVQTQPSLQDKQLLNQMHLEEGEFYFDHVWRGAAFHKFAGLPFSTHNFVHVDSNVEVMGMWLDPSFKGGDYTALACLGRRIDTGKITVFGRAWRSAWNMEPAISGIKQMYDRWKPSFFWFEDNSLGTVPRGILADKGMKALGVTTVQNKEDKIYKVAAHSRHLIDIATNYSDPVWVRQIREYNDDAENDDAPDSLASVITQSGIIKEKLKF